MYKCSGDVVYYQSNLCQDDGTPRHLAVKVSGDSQLVFAVEVIAASQARGLAQEQKCWQGRIFLPMLHAIGDGSVAETTAKEGTQTTSMLVMELAHGTLHNHDGFEGDSLVMIAWALANTLSLLNIAGFIHGDIKPGNVLWCEDEKLKSGNAGDIPSGWPLLTDFGSAQCFHSMRLEREPVKNDEELEVYGWTPAFAAPEVHRYRGKWQTVRSDMFSYAMTLKKISTSSEMPDVLLEVCKKCLEEDPKQRPESFLDIANALEDSCPKCLAWGEQLWHRQQAEFLSPALAHQHTETLQKQGLQVLLVQRKERLAGLMKGRKTKQVMEPYIELAAHLLSMGSPLEACDLHQDALVLNPCWAVHPRLLSNLGNAEGDLGNAAQQRELLERALKIFEGFYGQDHLEVARALSNLGNAEGSLGNAAQQKELLERALKIFEGFYGQDHPEVAKTLGNLGNAEGDLGNAAQKKELLERALKIFEGFYGQDHPELAKTLCNLGNAEGSLGNAAQQKELLERALKIFEGFYGQDHPEVAKILCNLGNAEGDLGNAAQQKELLERALKIVEGIYGQDHLEVARALSNLGTAEGALGNAAQQKELLERALKIEEGFYGQDHPEVAKILCNLGNAEGDLGNAAQKKELLERALKIKEGFYGQDHLEVARALSNLGTAEGALGNAAQQKELLERALKIFEGFYGQDHPEVAKTLGNLGNAEGDLGNAAQKKELLERALKIKEGFYGQDHPEVAITLFNLGRSELLLHQYVSGKKNFERAFEIFVKRCGRSHPHTIRAQQMLSSLESVEASP